MQSNTRKHERVPVSMEVHYRTKGSFLVSYSLNLSKGGLFLETTNLYPVGTQLTVRFTIPGATQTIETSAKVMWVRSIISEEGLPTGVGLKFEQLEDHIGAIIDRLVQDFTGMRLLALANDTPALERLSRYLRSIITCEVEQATVTNTLASGFALRIDLVLIDLDSAGPEGLAVLKLGRETSPPIPMVALSRSAEDRAAALQLGTAAALENPPPYEVLREKILEVLGKPCRASSD